jgi:hypothetical protein
MLISSKARQNRPSKIRERREKWVLWLSKLKVGDEVVIRYRQKLEIVQHIDTVQHITRSQFPNRTIVYVNDQAYRFESFEQLPGFGADTKTIWGSDSRFYKLGLRDRARQNALRLIFDQSTRNLSDEELVQIVEVLRASKIVNNKPLATRTVAELSEVIERGEVDLDRIVDRPLDAGGASADEDAND